jgi:hypothetical protein
MEKKYPEETPEPVGAFIMDQSGLTPMVTGNGYYWHYKDVVTLLTRYVEEKKPVWVKASAFKYEAGVCYHAKDSKSKGAGSFDAFGNFFWGDHSMTPGDSQDDLLILDESGQALAGGE